MTARTIPIRSNRARCAASTRTTFAIASFGALLVAAGCASRLPAPVVDRGNPATSSARPTPPVPAPPVSSASPQSPATSSAATPAPPEKDWRPEFYTVKRGDTLHQIALEHGLDYRELAAMNNVENVNLIRAGQILRVRPAADVALTGPSGAPSGDGRTDARAAADKAASDKAASDKATADKANGDKSAAERAGAPDRAAADRAGADKGGPDKGGPDKGTDRDRSTERPLADARAGDQRPRAADNYKTGPKAIKLPFSEAAFAQLMTSGAKAESGSSPSSAAAPAPVVSSTPAAPPASATAALPSAPPASTAPASSAPGVAPPNVIPPLASAAPSMSSPPAPPPPPLAAPSAPSEDERVDWGWPARGRLLSGYSESATLKGIDIGGNAGIPVVASAPGKVVYAGSGLRGYGKLVIVKHNKTYLSAYAHLDQITVKEGQAIAKGQELGKMGNTDADQVKLHFEIRSLGKPVDPLRYLPKG